METPGGKERKRGIRMTGSAYQAWLNKDREWIGAYCSRTRKSSLTKVVPLTLLLTALVLGGMEIGRAHV